MTAPGVTICVATYGSGWWVDMAHKRAIPSAEAQEVRVVYRHADNVARARNLALAQVETRWVLYLDADDELAEGYVDALLAADGDVRVPAVQRVDRLGRALRAPFLWRVAGHNHRCGTGCIPAGNWCPVGSMVDTGRMRSAGGWREWPVHEEWDLWLRLWQAGAEFVPVPGAVYLHHDRPGSRKLWGSPSDRRAVHRAILEANGLNREASGAA